MKYKIEQESSEPSWRQLSAMTSSTNVMKKIPRQTFFAGAAAGFLAAAAG
jgi:hypothetical protein